MYKNKDDEILMPSMYKLITYTNQILISHIPEGTHTLKLVNKLRCVTNWLVP